MSAMRGFGPPADTPAATDEYGGNVDSLHGDYDDRTRSTRGPVGHHPDDPNHAQGQERRHAAFAYSDITRGSHHIPAPPPPAYHPHSSYHPQWPPAAQTAPVPAQQSHYYYDEDQHYPLSHSPAASIPPRSAPPLAAPPHLGYAPPHPSHPHFPPPAPPGYYYEPQPPPMGYPPPPPSYEGYPHGPPGYPPHHSYYHGYPPPSHDRPLVPTYYPPAPTGPQQPRVLHNISNKRKLSDDHRIPMSKRMSPMEVLQEEASLKRPAKEAMLIPDTGSRHQQGRGGAPVNQQPEEDFLRHRMTDRDLLRHFYNYYHTGDMSLRAYTTQQHIGRSQFMRRWKELDVSSFKGQGVAFDDSQVLEQRVATFFSHRQERVVKHSTGGCKSFLTTDEEETFLATMAEKAGTGMDDNGITKEIFLPTIIEIVQKDLPPELTDFVSNAIVESLWERKLNGIKKLSELKASKRVAARIKDNRLQVGNIHTKQREIKATKEFLGKLYAYMEKKQDSYWTIVQSKEADGDSSNTDRAQTSLLNKRMDTSKEELYLMAQLIFDEDVFKEIKAGKPWVDLLRLRVRSQVTDQGISLHKEMFDAKVRELESSTKSKEVELKMMKDALSST